jgi:lactoylglutathione lyase
MVSTNKRRASRGWPLRRVFLMMLLAIAANAAAADDDATVVQSKFELFVADAEVSARFYTTLGFTVVQANPDGYTTLQSGPAIVALSPVTTWLPLRWFRFLRHPPLGTEIVLYTRQLQALRERLIESGYAPGTIVLQPWGLRDFRVDDHDGYYVRVTEGLALPVRNRS